MVILIVIYLNGIISNLIRTTLILLGVRPLARNTAKQKIEE